MQSYSHMHINQLSARICGSNFTNDGKDWVHRQTTLERIFRLSMWCYFWFIFNEFLSTALFWHCWDGWQQVSTFAFGGLIGKVSMPWWNLKISVGMWDLFHHHSITYSVSHVRLRSRFSRAYASLSIDKSLRELPFWGFPPFFSSISFIHNRP